MITKFSANVFSLLENHSSDSEDEQTKSPNNLPEEEYSSKNFKKDQKKNVTDEKNLKERDQNIVSQKSRNGKNSENLKKNYTKNYESRNQYRNQHNNYYQKRYNNYNKYQNEETNQEEGYKNNEVSNYKKRERGQSGYRNKSYNRKQGEQVRKSSRSYPRADHGYVRKDQREDNRYPYANREVERRYGQGGNTRKYYDENRTLYII